MPWSRHCTHGDSDATAAWSILGRGSQNVSINYSEQLSRGGVESSVGNKGDRYGNTPAGSVRAFRLTFAMWHGTGQVEGMGKHHHEDESKASLENLPAVDEQRATAAAQAGAASQRQGAPRVLDPKRVQTELRASDLKSLLPEDHRARLVRVTSSDRT